MDNSPLKMSDILTARPAGAARSQLPRGLCPGADEEWSPAHLFHVSTGKGQAAAWALPIFSFAVYDTRQPRRTANVRATGCLLYKVF